jgi:hypothetical protein
MKTLILILTMYIIGCGGELIADEQEPPAQNDTYEDADSCGNRICEASEGEDYWNCFDCVNPFTGGPKKGYCGDGICFNESMTSCWTDCKPRTYNSKAIADSPLPGQNIKTLINHEPIPGLPPMPGPGPFPGPDK